MSIKLKLAAALAVALASLSGHNSANAFPCDGNTYMGDGARRVQCYYLPTVAGGRVTGVHKQVNSSGFNRAGGPIPSGVESPCNGTMRYSPVLGRSQCYFLPVVTGGRVTGLQQHVSLYGSGTGHRFGGRGF